MRLGLGLTALITLGLVGCSGIQGSSGITGTDLASVRTSPAGMALLTFLDLEAIRPDLLASGAATPPAGMTVVSRTPGVSLVLGFANYTAANGGTITTSGANSNLTITPDPTNAANVTYTETFNNVTITAAGTVAGSTQTWVYSGAQQVQIVGGSTATLSTPSAIIATLTDSGTPSRNATYSFDFTQPLSANWVTVNNITTSLGLSGAFVATNRTTGDMLTCTVGGTSVSNALTWTPACADYPINGGISIALASVAYGNSTIPVTFNGTCGQVVISGGTITLGGH